MLEMLKARKEELEAQGKKGFTLMEMLIVVAIIAILIAIAIPVFTAQLNSAKIAADEANARSIYAMVMADYMDDNTINSTGLTGTQTTLNANADNTVNGQTFHLSDQTTSCVINTPADAAPSVVITFTDATKNQTFGVAPTA